MKIKNYRNKFFYFKDWIHKLKVVALDTSRFSKALRKTDGVSCNDPPLYIKHSIHNKGATIV